MTPTYRLLLLLLGPTLISAIAVAFPFARSWIVGADIALLVVVFLDLLTLPRRRAVGVTRRGDHNLSVGARNRFVVTLENRLRRRLHVMLTESFPDSMAVEGLPLEVTLAPRQSRRFAYWVTPQRRGAHTIGRTYLFADSLLGTWRRRLRIKLDHSLKVFPDVRALSTYALLARRNRIDLMGFRQARGRASDVEFDRLRDYSPDDDYRRIDPFATARYQRLITREYQVSRNQNIFFMVDCGRLMASESAGLTNLDHALNAVLMLSSLAIDSGDNVGLIAFDRDVRAFLPIGGGFRRKSAVLHSLYDLQLSQQDPDYGQAFSLVLRRVRQRSLVVLLTNVMDGATYSMLLPHLHAITRRHLPLVVLMRDQDLFTLADKSPASLREFFSVGAAAELARWREQLAARIQRIGSMVLDLTPAQTTPQIINRYLQIKADRLL
ncbi:MAG: DUF58 domain-containing protein [Deltaproteobacteria bacterium]|nr:DUF58 domain-containing protein [Deltaproteobacteria bacterium]